MAIIGNSLLESLIATCLNDGEYLCHVDYLLDAVERNGLLLKVGPPSLQNCWVIDDFLVRLVAEVSYRQEL